MTNDEGGGVRFVIRHSSFCIPPPLMNAIAAMSLNRVIGQGGHLPWHLPEEFRWFKQTTSGGVVLMGRKTFDSLGRPLPNRLNLVVSRTGERAGAEMVRDLAAFDPEIYRPR